MTNYLEIRSATPDDVPQIFTLIKALAEYEKLSHKVTGSVEDLFVLPEYRRKGIGKAILSYLGKLAVARGVGRLEWSVLAWNESAIAFYQSMGAEVLPDWRICRVTGNSLKILAHIQQ